MGPLSRRIKTVEIIVDESEWEKPVEKEPREETGPHEVGVRIPLMREDLVATLRRKRAVYNEETKEWRMPCTVAIRHMKDGVISDSDITEAMLR